MIDRLLDLLCWFSDRREARGQAALAEAMAERYDVVLFEEEWIAVEKPDYWERVRSA